MFFFYFFINLILFYFLYISKDFVSKKLHLVKFAQKNTFHKQNSYLYGGILLFPSLVITHEYLEHIKIEKLYFNYFLVFSFLILAIIDDIKNLKAIIKFFFVSILSSIAIFFDITLTINSLNSYFFQLFVFTDNLLIIYFFPILCILLLINAFNFTDGLNCLAGLVGLSFLIYICIKNYEVINSLYLFIVSIILFLYLNYKKNVFLGDSGNYLISIIVAVIILKENFYYPKSYYMEEIFLLFFIPGVDMFRLFITRIKKKRNPFDRDDNHLHYILFYNFGYHKTILIYLALVNIPIYIFYFFSNLLLVIILLTLFFYTYLIYICYLNKNKAT